MKILIFGHSGSGKSTLAEPFARLINGVWINADHVRDRDGDYDFSEEGRFRQATRMTHIAEGVEMAGKIAVLDFICPTNDTRRIVNPDYTIWMDTVNESKYSDTNELFEKPDLENIDYHVSGWFDDTPQQLLEVVESYIKRNHLND